MKIDFHVHAFPDALAHRAMEGLSKTAEEFHGRVNILPVTDGTAAQARTKLKEYGMEMIYI